MKMMPIFGLLLSTMAFAQTPAPSNPMEVCEAIRRNTGYAERVTSCIQIVSRNSFDPKVIRVLIDLSSNSTTETLNALQASANATYDAGALKTCSTIRTQTGYTERVTECLKTTANNVYSPEISALASRLATSNTIEANNIMKVAMNAYFLPSAVEVCERVRLETGYSERVTQCVSTIKNKTFMNNAESYCKNITSSNTVEAIRCLSQAALDYVPAPPQKDILMSESELRNLRHDVMKTRALLERGMIEQAQAKLGDVIRDIETIEANNHVR